MHPTSYLVECPANPSCAHVGLTLGGTVKGDPVKVCSNCLPRVHRLRRLSCAAAFTGNHEGRLRERHQHDRYGRGVRPRRIRAAHRYRSQGARHSSLRSRWRTRTKLGVSPRIRRLLLASARPYARMYSMLRYRDSEGCGPSGASPSEGIDTGGCGAESGVS